MNNCGECGMECQTPCYFLFMMNAERVSKKKEEHKTTEEEPRHDN